MAGPIPQRRRGGSGHDTLKFTVAVLGEGMGMRASTSRKTMSGTTAKPGMPFAFCLACVLNLVACSATEPENAPVTGQSGISMETTIPDSTLPDRNGLDGVIDAAKRDLSQRLGIEPGAISITEARAVTWRSSAAGCPRPGMNYAQALVPGHLVVLAAGQRTYAFHSAGDALPFFCPPENREPPIDSPSAD